MRCADDLAPAYDALLQAVADGELTPVEAIQITRILESQAQVVGFQSGPPWQPDTVERLTEMQEEDDKAAEAGQQEAA